MRRGINPIIKTEKVELTSRVLLCVLCELCERYLFMGEINMAEVIITDQAFEALELIAFDRLSLEQAAYRMGIEPWEVNYHVKETLYRIDQARRYGMRLKR